MTKKEELFSYLDVNIDENNIEMQDIFLKILKQIIEKIVGLNYTKSNKTFTYPSTGELYGKLYYLYSTKKSVEDIEQFAKELYQYIDGAIPVSKIISSIKLCFEYWSYINDNIDETLDARINALIKQNDYQTAKNIITYYFVDKSMFYYEIIGTNLIQYIKKSDANYQKLVEAIKIRLRERNESNINFINDFEEYFKNEDSKNQKIGLRMVECLRKNNYEEAAKLWAKVLIADEDFHNLRSILSIFLDLTGNDFIDYCSQKINDPITLFCNRILNVFENNWKNNKYEEYIRDIKKLLKVTKKKRVLLDYSRRNEMVEEIFRYRKEYYYKLNFDSLDDMYKDLKKEIEAVKEDIIRNKKIRKYQPKLDIENIDTVIRLEFVQKGKINVDALIRRYKELTNEELNIEAAKLISKKINYIKDRYIKILEKDYIGRVTSRDLENIKGDFDLNINNFVIGDNYRCQKIISEFKEKINEQTAAKILENKNIKDVLFLLPFVGLLKDFDVNTFIKILINIDKIEEEMNITGNNSNTSIELLNNLDSVINIANGLSKFHDCYRTILGERFMKKFMGRERVISFQIEYYVEMINAPRRIIPPTLYKKYNTTYKSGDNFDPLRMLIGDIELNSCYSLGSPMSDFVLKGKDGDVILIKEKDEVKTRAFVFRRGNVVQIVSYARRISPYEVSIYEEIAKQIIEKAKEKNDNIDYVFLNETSVNQEYEEYNNLAQKYMLIEDDSFVNEFSHADTGRTAYLLCSKNNIKDEDSIKKGMDFSAKPMATYEGARNKVIMAVANNNTPKLSELNNYEVVSIEEVKEEILKLRILEKVMLMADKLVDHNDYDRYNEELSKTYRIVRDEFEKVFLGLDWYIAVRKDGSIEELKLPRTDTQAMEKEMAEARKVLGIEPIRDTIDNTMQNKNM